MGRIPFDLDRSELDRHHMAGRSTRNRDNRFFGMNGPAKRTLDLVLTVPALLFLLPVFAIIALLVRLDGGPFLYSQLRVGRGGETFRMIKFRTMRVDADKVLVDLLARCPASRSEWEHFQKLRNDPRITRVGRILRKTSLDELPQLFNILIGDMSLVGQRPILLDQRKQYGAHIIGYERARPGLTGLWQIRGRNALSFDDRAVMGTEYVNAWSLWGDIKLLFQTIPALLLTRDAY